MSKPAEEREEITLSEDEQRRAELRLKRKVDFRLIPMLVIIYILNYIDRNNISAARLKGLEQDLALTDQDYQTSLSILYVGYILMQVPSNLLLHKIGRPSIYLPTCVIIWGTLSALTAVAKNYRDIIVIRFFLGFIEAAFFPGALYVMSRFYTKKEYATRVTLLYAGSILSNAFGGLLAAGILSGLEGANGIRGWRWLFIVEGCLTILSGLIAFVVLPDFPENTRWLTEEERLVAQRRSIQDAGEKDDDEGVSMWRAFVMAMTDIKVWILAFMLTAAVVGLSFNAFFPTLTATLGYSSTVTLLLTAPPWFFAYLVMLTNALHADKTGERTIHVVWPFLVAIVGLIIATSTSALGARFFALFLLAQSYAGFVIILTWISNSIPRPPAKRAVSLAFVNAFSQLGNIAGSYVFPAAWGPSYKNSFAICITMFGLAS
ncbi:hypothetical protein BZG36_04953, partial [Bifiguratus adelaidae]